MPNPLARSPFCSFVNIPFLCRLNYCRSCIASVAKWLAHLPFTSEAAGSSLSENFLNATRTQSSCEKSKSQRSAESRGFPPGTPVSSHRESWQGGLGKKGQQ